MKPVITEYHTKPTETKTIYRWWNEPLDQIHSTIFPLVEKMQTYQSYRTTQNLKFARLYSNMDMLGLTSGTYTRIGAATSTYNQNRLTLNIVQSCIDTAAAKIAKNKPRPLFLTKKGNWTNKRKAQKLTQYLDGQFELCNVYETGQRCFVDAEVFGTGALKVFIDPIEQEIKCERIFIEEIIVDDVEGLYGFPRQMHQKKNYSRDILLDMFPKYKDAIMGCPTISGTSPNTISDQILVIESWHLPSSSKSNDGRHSICVNGATLFSEVYTKDYFPIIFFRWIPKLLGFFGMGLAEQLIGIQLEINKVLVNIQAAQHLMCVPRILIEDGSKVNTAMITNEIGTILKYRGVKPSFEVGNGMPAETYAYLENLIKKAYEITGVSQLSASQKKPSGIDSGAALREYQDIESERFMLTGMRYEKFYMDIAKVMIDLSKDLYESNPKLAIKVASNKFVETIKWKDVNLKEDEYAMQMFPVSLLPTTPAGKLETVQTLTQAGFMSPEDAMQLLDFPDLDNWMARKNAASDNINRILERIMEDGKYTVPEKIMNLELAEEITSETILQGLNDGLDPDKIDLLRTFLQDVQTLLQQNAPPPQPAAPQQPAQPAQPEVPQGQPAAPPTADMMPFANG